MEDKEFQAEILYSQIDYFLEQKVQKTLLDYKLKGMDQGKALILDSMIVGFFDIYLNKNYSQDSQFQKNKILELLKFQKTASISVQNTQKLRVLIDCILKEGSDLYKNFETIMEQLIQVNKKNQQGSQQQQKSDDQQQLKMENQLNEMDFNEQQNPRKIQQNKIKVELKQVQNDEEEELQELQPSQEYMQELFPKQEEFKKEIFKKSQQKIEQIQKYFWQEEEFKQPNLIRQQSKKKAEDQIQTNFVIQQKKLQQLFQKQQQEKMGLEEMRSALIAKRISWQKRNQEIEVIRQEIQKPGFVNRINFGEISDDQKLLYLDAVHGLRLPEDLQRQIDYFEKKLNKKREVVLEYKKSSHNNNQKLSIVDNIRNNLERCLDLIQNKDLDQKSQKKNVIRFRECIEIEPNFVDNFLQLNNLNYDQWSNMNFNNQEQQIIQCIENLAFLNLIEQDEIYKMCFEIFDHEREEFKEYSCKICLDVIESSVDMHLMDTCSHIFHVSCLEEYFISKYTEKNFPITCPEFSCKIEVSNYDLKTILNEDQYKKCIDFSLGYFIDKKNQDFMYCPTTDCSYIFGKDPDVTEFKCPVCSKHYCLDCKTEFHDGMDCKTFKALGIKNVNDYKFEQFAQSNHFKRCYSCHFWIVKSEGCNHMTCRCKAQFCYICEAVWKTCGCPQYDNDDYEDMVWRMNR